MTLESGLWPQRTCLYLTLKEKDFKNLQTKTLNIMMLKQRFLYLNLKRSPPFCCCLLIVMRCNFVEVSFKKVSYAVSLNLAGSFREEVC